MFYWVFLVDILFHLSHLEFFISVLRLVPRISLIYIFRYGTLVICFLISPTSENAFPLLMHMNCLCQVRSTGVTIILAAMPHCLLKLRRFKGKFDCQQWELSAWRKKPQHIQIQIASINITLQKMLYVFSCPYS